MVAMEKKALAICGVQYWTAWMKDLMVGEIPGGCAADRVCIGRIEGQMIPKGSECLETPRLKIQGILQ